MVCNRCGKTVRTSFVFYEMDAQNRHHRFGSFCRKCTIELVDMLKGKVEWFRIQDGWRGYILANARSELEEMGFISPKYDTQYIEIKKIGGKEGSMKNKNLDILRMEYAAGLISQQEYKKQLAHR